MTRKTKRQVSKQHPMADDMVSDVVMAECVDCKVSALLKLDMTIMFRDRSAVLNYEGRCPSCGHPVAQYLSIADSEKARSWEYVRGLGEVARAGGWSVLVNDSPDLVN